MVIIDLGHFGKVGQADGGSLYFKPIGKLSESFRSISHILAELYMFVLIGWLDHHRS